MKLKSLKYQRPPKRPWNLSGNIERNNLRLTHPLPSRPFFPCIQSPFATTARYVLLIFSHSVGDHVVPNTENWRERIRELHDCNCSDETRNGLNLGYCRSYDESCDGKIYMSVIRDDVLRITQSPVEESKDYKCQDHRVLADVRGWRQGTHLSRWPFPS